MYVRPGWRGRGLARRLLAHLVRVAGDAGATRVRLETGIHRHEAIGLYEDVGFVRCAPFGDDRDDPLGRCYELPLSPR